MEWIKKNLGWIGFAIFLLGTCIAGIAKFFYDKDWSLLGCPFQKLNPWHNLV
jgi:hypothetical protein